jgi:calmodulin
MDYGLTQERVEELQQVFAKHAKPELGGIPISDLHLALETAGVATGQAGEPKREGVVVTMEQFLRKAAENIQNAVAQEDLLEAFRVFDVSGSGFVATSDLIEVMQGYQNTQGIARDEIVQLIKEADVDHDGKIDYHEFISMLFEI